MNERYTTLWKLRSDLYAEGSPVVIAAGSLLKDSADEKVLALIKYQNISNIPVKALTVRISPKDTLGNPLSEAVEYQYLDLSARRDEFFGQKTPVFLPNASARSFDIAVSEVIFGDNSVWRDSVHNWEPLSVKTSLLSFLGDPQLVKQYKLEYGSACQYCYHAEKDLWRCACGALNHADEPLCHSCSADAENLASVTLEALQAAKDERLEQEAKRAEEARLAAEKARADAERAAQERRRKIKKYTCIAAPILAVIIAVAAFTSHISAVKKAYPAKELCDYIRENGSYEETIKLSDSIPVFSGYSAAVSEKSDTVTTSYILYVDKTDNSGFWSQALLPMEGRNLEINTHFSYPDGEGIMEYSGVFPAVITLLDGSKADLEFYGSTSIADYSKNTKLTIDDLNLVNTGLSERELSSFQITQEMKDAYADTLTNIFQTLQMTCLKSYTEVVMHKSLEDIGFQSWE